MSIGHHRTRHGRCDRDVQVIQDRHKVGSDQLCSSDCSQKTRLQKGDGALGPNFEEQAAIPFSLICVAAGSLPQSQCFCLEPRERRNSNVHVRTIDVWYPFTRTCVHLK